MPTSAPLPVRIGLSAPRVAVVFDGGEGWHYWVRLAIHAATRFWGGRGFLLVPHVDGVVAPVLLAAARAYDPDYVVLMETTFGQRENVAPGRLAIGMEGRVLEGDERADLFKQVADQPVHDAAGTRARQAVAAACSPYRRRRDGPEGERLTSLGVAGAAGPLTPLNSIPAVAGSPYLSAPRGWGGALGVMVAAQYGLFEEPAVGQSPDLSEADRRQMLLGLTMRGAAPAPPDETLLGRFVVPFQEGDDPHRSGTAFQRTTLGLAQAGFGHRDKHHITFVVGDSAADFAAAYARDQLYGDGVWLPSELSPRGTGTNARRMRVLLESAHVRTLAFRHGRVTVSTVSADPDTVEGTVTALHNPEVKFSGSAIGDQKSLLVEVVRAGDLTFPRSGELSWVVAEDFDHPAVVPAMIDENGTKSMLSSTPVPDVSAADLRASVDLTWQVEVQPEGAGTPGGRGLDGGCLLESGENEYLTWVRSGRNGTRFEAHRYDFVGAGTPRLSRLARPKLREPSLREWASCLAIQQGKSVRLSDAGRRAEVLSRRVGGRARLAALLAGPMLPVLCGYLSDTPKTNDRYPEGQGVVLHAAGTNDAGYEGYLNYRGMTHFDAREDPDGLEEDVDFLLTTGLLRLGIVVNCDVCARVNFIALDDAGQTIICPRCGASNPLTRDRWKRMSNDPPWYYDLHPVARDLLRNNGHVPLQLAHHLRLAARSYTDAPELELCGPDGKPIAELDLPAYADGQVIVSEVKSSATLGTRPSRQVNKKILLAEALQADQVLFGTTQSQWDPASLDAIGRTVRLHRWASGTTPDVRIITALGLPTCQDMRMNLEAGALTSW